MNRFQEECAELARLLGTPAGDESPERPVHRPVDWLVDRALSHPLGTMGLDQFLFPGDRVVVGVADPLPAAEGLIEAIGRAIARIVLEPGQTAESDPHSGDPVFLFASPGEMPASGRMELGDGLSLRCLLHAPEDEQAMALLAAGPDLQPLNVNRALFDADAVILLRCPALGGGRSRQSRASGLWPLFADSAGKRAHSRLPPVRAEAERESVDSHLGVVIEFCLLAVPGGGIEEVLFGTREEVRIRAAVELDRLWIAPTPGNSDLVIATVENPADTDPWRDVRAGLLVADRAGQEGAPLVLWSTVESSADDRFREELARSLDAGESEAGGAIASILQRRPVYLRSGLSRLEVEDLGLGHLESMEELRRLHQRAHRPLLLRDAHRYGIPEELPEVGTMAPEGPAGGRRRRPKRSK